MKKRILILSIFCVLLLLGEGHFQRKTVVAEDVADIYVEPAREREWVVGDCVGEEDFYVYPVNGKGQIATEPLSPEQYTVEPGSITEAGENLITVEYGQFFSYTTVFAKEDKLEGIVATLREGNMLFAGEQVLKEDLCVYAYYSSGYKEEITPKVRIEGSFLKEGENEVPIVYEHEDQMFSYLLKIVGHKPTVTPVSSSGLVSSPPVSEYTPAPTKSTVKKTKVSYALSSSIKGIAFLKKGGMKKTVYSPKKWQGTLKVSGIASIQYKMQEKNKKKENSWKKVKNKKISVNKMGSWQLYVRFQTNDGKTIEKKTNPFVLDWKKPDVLGVKNGGTYRNRVWFQCEDKLSGIKKVTLNGKKCAKKKKVSKSGVYKLVVKDCAGNQTKVKFTVVKPTPRPTPKPTPKPQAPAPAPYVPVESVRCSKRTVTLKVGKSVSLSATVLPENATNRSVSWKSSASGIAKVSASGKVTAKKKGTAYVIVRSKSNTKAYATCVVYVE